MDLYYTHLSGNTYTVYLVVYGDCAGGAFSSLSSSTPAIGVYDGGSLLTNISLNIHSPTSGVEVTPICPSQIGHTTCTNPSYSLPGVKKFVYSGNVTLPYTSATWRFLFSSGMGGSYTAGRSGGITNINFPAGSGSPIELVDTLNNTVVDNSSAICTSVPTPFFCISNPANYNPAAIDPDGDPLAFDLVPAVDASTGVSVNYVYPYTATAPLGVVSGSFSFTTASGQLSFTPSITQKALVVYNIREYSASGALKGTSQREMTVVVLSPCTNHPPSGGMSSASAGYIINPTQLNICSSSDSVNFHLNPTDADGDSIIMSVSGLPTGATLSTLNNGTPSPTSTFRWNFAGVAPGTYTFYVTYQDSGCPFSSTQTIAYSITIYPSPTQSITVISPVTCTRRAILNINTGGGSGPYVVNILIGATSIHTFTGVTTTITDSLVAGTYTFRSYNTSSCYTDTSIALASPPVPYGRTTLTAPGCAGASTGSVSVVGYGTSSPYSYAIGSGSYSASGVFTGLAASTYTVHIRDVNGCTKDTAITLGDPPSILERIYLRKPTCDTFSNGQIIINAYHSTGPYTFAIGSGAYATNDTFEHLAAGTYTFHVRNIYGCVDDTTITITDSMRLRGSFSIPPISCHGDTVTVTVSGVGGYPTYSYACDSGTFGAAGAFYMTGGTYVFHITDAQSCHLDTSITIAQPAPIYIAPVLRNVTCFGMPTGSATISATGGTPTYQYGADGSTFTTSPTITGLYSGTHILGVRDANGCLAYDTVVLTEPSPIVIDSISMVMPPCNGSASGNIRLVASGGVGGFTYAVNTGAFSSSSSFTGLAAGTYTLHVKDANGCIKDTVVTMGQPSPIVPLPTVTPSLCNTLANGQVLLAATGGTPGYMYAIGTSAYNASGLFLTVPAGTFVFHIKDANGCTKDTSLTIVNTLHIAGIFNFTPPACHGDTNGVITITGTGGHAPYRYAMSAASFDTASVFPNLSANTYLFHIEDSNGCIADTSVALSQPAILVVSATITPPSCFGLADGSVLASATGGRPAYTFSLNRSPFTSTTTFSALAAGNDTLFVRDDHGCMSSTVFLVTQPSLLRITSLTGTGISCNNGTDGTLTVVGAGGTVPYHYAANLSGYQTSNILTGLAAGTQVIHLKDTHGCRRDTTFTLTEPAPLNFPSALVINPTCEGNADGSLVLQPRGGTMPYAFSTDNVDFWSNATFTNIREGTYTYFVRDAHQCIADTTITFVGYPHILIESVHIKNPSCVGNKNGALTIVASGGTQPFNYTISGDAIQQSPNVFDHLYVGAYTLTITDKLQCRKDTTIIITQPDTFKVTANVTPNECNSAENTGAIKLSISGGTPPYSYLWLEDSSTKAFVTGKPNGFYTAQVRDTNNCQDSVTAQIMFDDCCIPFIPTAFSPNGDGRNDEFRIKYKGDIRIIEFSIFNRFGERVFISEYSEHGWDGTYKGVDAEIGVYYYYIRLLCGNRHNEIQEFKGDVTLVR